MIGVDSGFVVDLFDGGDYGSDVLGTKAATLAHLAAAGFRVPDGFVITRAACDRIVAAAGDVGSTTEADMPAEVWKQVRSHLERLGEGPVAVRSSGLAEDLSHASFAGQYETVLDVEGPQALAAAVGRCLASAGSGQVRAYTGSEERAPMALLVQRMIPADVAGVAFTANPITGDPDVLVSAVKGLGDRLVSGQVTPDEWVVRAGEASCVRSPEGVLDEQLTIGIADLATALERLLGVSQDVEWAIADGEIFVLQARPITALPVAPNLEVPSEGFWLKATAHYPTPFTPFGASVYLLLTSEVIAALAEEFGLLLEGIEELSLGGEVYERMIPLGGKDRPPPPSWAMWLAARLAPPLRRRARAAQSAVASGAPERILDSWENEWRPAFVAEIGELRSVDLASLDDPGLLGHLDRLKDLLRRGLELHFRLHVPHALAVYQLGEICEELLGWDVARALCLLTGTSVASSEPGRELRALAERIAADPAALRTVIDQRQDLLAGLRQSAPWAAAAFADYLDRYGHRTVSYDPGDPTLFERPHVVAGMLAEQVRKVTSTDTPDADVQPHALAEARNMLAGRSEHDRARFEQDLAFAQRAYGQREDNISWLDNRPCALLRYCAVEMGNRLARRGVLAHAGDAVFLEEAELRSALSEHNQCDLRALVGRRRAERAWVMAHPGPPSYGKDPGPPPDLSPLPAALRLVNAAFINLMDLIAAPSTPQHTESQLRGLPGSPGRYSGTVRIVHDETQFATLKPGEVLVAPTTSPPWSVLFLNAGAVITDGGGVLSHTAVIAREYGIPAVLATGDATRRLCNGDQVIVDGSTGVVSMAVAAG